MSLPKREGSQNRLQSYSQTLKYAIKAFQGQTLKLIGPFPIFRVAATPFTILIY
jgi:hypothetical protein